VNAIARFRGAAVALTLLVTVIGCSQLLPSLPIREPDKSGFSLSPEGDDVARLAPIVATFPKAPADRTPGSLLQLFPGVAGSYAWLTPRKLLFQPDFPGLLRGTTYTAIVPANRDAGLPDAVTRKFTVTGKLAVQQVIPGDKDAEVPLDAQVFLQFTRSVAPLTTLAAQPTDTVVTFDPPLHGKGEWLNTSIYRFLPEDLLPDKTYQVTVKRGLSSAVDGVLEQDFRSSFRTIGPAVDSIVPDAGWIYGGPWQEAVVTFNQPMTDAAGDGVVVTNSATGAAVPGTRSWNAAHTVVTFSPGARMANDTKYVISVSSGLKSARGGVTALSRTASFTVVGVPRVADTWPKNGEKAAGQYGVSLQFGSPMDPDSLDGKLSISGISDKDLEGHVNVWELGLSANVALKARTHYTVTLAPGAIDRYGQVMGGYTWSFTTGALPSSVSLALPSFGGSATYSASSEPLLWFQAINTPTVTFTLYPLTPGEARGAFHEYALGNPKWSPSLPATRTWTEKVASGPDEVRLAQTSLSGGGPLPKGAYLLATTSGGMGSRFAFAVVDSVIVTKLSQTELLAWALDHDSGTPLAGVPVHVDGGIAGDAVTDDRGLATFAVSKPVISANPNERSYYLTIGGARNGVVSTRWQGM